MAEKPTYEDLILKIRDLEKKASLYRHLEDVYRSVVESTSDSIYMVDKECRYLFMNNHRLSRLGMSIEQVIGKRYGDFHSPEEDREFTKAVEKVFYTGTSVQQEHRSERDKRYFLRTFSPVQGNSFCEKKSGVVVVSKDITRNKLAEETLRQSEQKYKIIIEDIEDGYYELDPSGNIIFFNDILLNMLGYSSEELTGMNYRNFTDEESALQLFHIFDQVMATGKPSRGIEIDIRKKDGSIRNAELSVSLILDEKGQATGFRNLIRDITERKRSQEMIRRLAYHDSLTGLPNRLLFIDRLNIAITRARRNRQFLAVMMLDLDYFKDINDSLGHHIGDQLLQGVGYRLTHLLRKGDTIARMGGDEFLILLSDIKRIEDTSVIAQKIIDAFQSAFIIDGRKLCITPSIGIAIYPNGSEDIDNLIKHADIAMYRAKGKGRNKYQIFSPVSDPMK
ncbi:MAG: diguanylate cyclase [Syntrophaceae bacterium]